MGAIASGSPRAQESIDVAHYGAMSPAEFLRKWARGGTAQGLNERQGAQSHFLDLCLLLNVPPPDDPESYCFERSFHQHNRALGFADVWKRGCFAWEYKTPGAALDKALSQLMQYALPLENPPLLVVSDRWTFQIHTHFTGYASECTTVVHADLASPSTRAKLRAIFLDPYSFQPTRTSVEITKAAAKRFAEIAERMQQRGVAPHRAAHFLTQCLFCLFAQDAGLLRTQLFKDLADNKQDAIGLHRGLESLFSAMRSGGDFGVENIPWFNGGLFEEIDIPLLDSHDLGAIREAAALDWRGLDPSIFGTLFERGLDPQKRRQLGAHYTDPETIAKLVLPVIERPLLAAWSETKAKLESLLASRNELRAEAELVPSLTKRQLAKFARVRTKANASEREAQNLFNGFLQKLCDFRVLDPACGSGNFLYVALRVLKDIEHKVNLEAESLGLHRQLPLTGPQNVIGLEVNAYAAELSRVTIWIGELQWRMRHGFGWKVNPVLDPLDQIACRDALINPDGTEADWPEASVIVGNPPFVGNKKMRRELGAAYVESVRRVYAAGVPPSADLVCYWVDKARRAINTQGLGAAGLVATQAIRRGANRSVLDAVVRDSRIFEAWADQEWVNEGAAVRVSMICFGRWQGQSRLDGADAPCLTADLRGSAAIDLTTAVPLAENQGIAFQGSTKVGAFEIPGNLARKWLAQPNPNGRSNAEVLRPWANGQALAGRPTDDWIVDFGADMTEAEARLYELPYKYVVEHVQADRAANNRPAYRRYWWRHAEARAGLRLACRGLGRFLATPRVAKHRYFVWLHASVLPDTRLYAIARDDDWTFGVLSSRMHEVWSLANASMHGVGNDPTYNARSCFESFPFPLDRGGANDPVAIATRNLVGLRDRWLNPAEWTVRLDEVVPVGLAATPYPERIVARDGFERAIQQRTMTALYNERPSWLMEAQAALDSAVALAYGWHDYSAKTKDEEVVRRLLEMNHQRAARKKSSPQLDLALIGAVGS